MNYKTEQKLDSWKESDEVVLRPSNHIPLEKRSKVLSDGVGRRKFIQSVELTTTRTYYTKTGYVCLHITHSNQRKDGLLENTAQTFFISKNGAHPFSVSKQEFIDIVENGDLHKTDKEWSY